MKKFLVANWKMNKTKQEAMAYMAGLREPRSVYVCIAAPYTLIANVVDYASGRSIEVGAQNMNAYSSGAYTGEISATMLRDAGARFVILGHSERRHIFGEKDEEIQAKVDRAVVEGLPFILCVGETDHERMQGETNEVIERQLQALEDLLEDQMGKVMIAYEPVWAIGTGKAAHPDDVRKVHQDIREIVGAKVPILYGGSVSPDNIMTFLKQENVDGALVGGASLSADMMNQMIQEIERQQIEA